MLVAALLLAVGSLASNVSTTTLVPGGGDGLTAVRLTVSRVLNSGTAWGGLAVLSGWLVRRPVQGLVAGLAACLVALVVHYGLGRLLGMFDPDVWAENVYWFQAAVLLTGALGVVGAIARRPDRWGLLARLVVPAAALLEPFVTGMFTSPAVMPWPDRVAGVAGGVILLAAGAAGATAVLLCAREHRRAAGHST